jgi:hypothetical protein
MDNLKGKKYLHTCWYFQKFICYNSEQSRGLRVLDYSKPTQLTKTDDVTMRESLRNMKSHVVMSIHFQLVQIRFRLYLFPSKYWLLSYYQEDIFVDDSFAKLFLWSGRAASNDIQRIRVVLET